MTGRPLKQGEKGYSPRNPLATEFERAREAGGGIQPGAHPAPGPQLGNPFKQIGGMIKKALAYNPSKRKR